ncbi:Sphingolipid C4-hydroxylase sur2 [Penicillium diatomitis]|uniref:Sphingolipid C4-hydroxylase sur2 n=1 Tax=Penicillium diatomitis TaxID=2819901 RepID=A0A9W9XEF1_9EURO|nr:Sphingolipid C4-hydroxylase sur2 [Penicillium diatomitis]KAJ5490749.1 Sphingolipid C4-hydroxylase sur2 [Penicillium diatomitis]
MAANASAVFDLPPLPTYTLSAREPLLPPIPDNVLALILPIIAYWGLSMVYHFIDVNGYFEQYRLHTPAEVLKRNKVTRWEVVRDVVLQQIIQTIAGYAMSYFDAVEVVGREDYDVAVWATRLRLLQTVIPSTLGFVGVDALGLSESLYHSGHSVLAGVLAGGSYRNLVQSMVLDNGVEVVAPAFASWELSVASIIYWYLIPGLQFALAVSILDTWQYFLHRAMHLNRWLYVTFHSRHHRLYVPYAFGALYNHPVEGFLLDTLGTGVGYLVSGMTSRQSMMFFTFSTIKTVDDHCGYAFPWDPLQHVTSNNAAYHDIHHQSWGIKTNFSQPFFTFWDRLLNTQWKGETKLRYERARENAQKQLEADIVQAQNETSISAPSLERERDRVVVSLDGPATRTRFRRKTVDSLKGPSHAVPGSVLHK